MDVTAGSVSLSNDTLSGYIVHGGKGGTGGSGIGGGLYIGTGRRPLYSSADSVNGLTGPGKLGRGDALAEGRIWSPNSDPPRQAGWSRSAG